MLLEWDLRERKWEVLVLHDDDHDDGVEDGDVCVWLRPAWTREATETQK